MVTRVLAALAAALAFGPGAVAAQDGEDPAFLTFGAGYYDVNDDWDAAEFRLEYWSDSKWWIFKPFGGLMATSDAAAYVYAGIRLDVYLGNRWVLTPSFAPGFYHDGDGKDLGHAVEFRSNLDIAYRFDDRSRLGIGLYHLSNAGLDDNNPGTEVVSVHYALPLTNLFQD